MFEDMFRDFEELFPTGLPRAETNRPRVVLHTIRSLKPDRIWHRPALFVLETIAALVSVLALRDLIAGGDDFAVLAAIATASWLTLLAVAVARTIRAQRRWCARSSRREARPREN